MCPRLLTNLVIAPSAVGTSPNTSRWRAGSATYPPVWNQRIIASRSLTIGLNGPTNCRRSVDQASRDGAHPHLLTGHLAARDLGDLLQHQRGLGWASPRCSTVSMM